MLSGAAPSTPKLASDKRYGKQAIRCRSPARMSVKKPSYKGVCIPPSTARPLVNTLVDNMTHAGTVKDQSSPLAIAGCGTGSPAALASRDSSNFRAVSRGATSCEGEWTTS